MADVVHFNVLWHTLAISRRANANLFMGNVFTDHPNLAFYAQGYTEEEVRHALEYYIDKYRSEHDPLTMCIAPLV